MASSVTNPKPPRQIKILLINPNATASMTTSCLASIAPTLPPDVIVTGFTAPAPAPTAIESESDGIMSAAACIKAIYPIAAAHDAFLVACFSDHPLTTMLREEFPQPAIGIMEASCYAARTLGGRIGLVATGSRVAVQGEDSIRHLGLGGYVVPVEHCGMGPLDLEEKGEEVVFGIMAGVGKRLVEQRGADVLLLGCAGMSRLKPVVERAVGADVQVVDGVLAGVHHLIGLVRQGAGTAKKALYASAAEARRRRGQDYF